MDPLVLEVVRGVPSVEPQLLGLVAVGPVLLIALADQESNPLLAFLKQKSYCLRTTSEPGEQLNIRLEALLSFCITSAPLASTRWVRSTYLSLCYPLL